MNKKAREIYYMFDGKLVGNKLMKNSVCQTLSEMSEQIIKFVTKNCWFISSMDDAYGFAFTGNDLKDQHMIFLSDELFGQDGNQIRYTIAHEIGHVVLKHRNSTLVRQTKEEIKRQEKEADEFVRTNLEEKI